MELSRSRILVTGADGFIGSHLTEALVRRGFDVKALVMYNSFNNRGWLEQLPPTMLKKLDISSGDIRDPHGIREIMRGCDVVFHLAALIAIPYSYHSPDTYVDTNIKGTLNVLQAARDLGVSRVVHTSTSEVYGTAQYVPITEDHPLQGQSPYSASKIGADHLALSFHRSFDLPVALIRPFNTYGPRQSARAVIPSIITQLASGKRRLQLGATHPTRDFSHVDDTVRGFIRIAECDDAVGDVINIGSGFEVSIGDTAQLIAELMGCEIEVETAPERLRPAGSEVERLWASTDKAEKLLGHKPLHHGIKGLREGLESTIDWFSDPSNLVFYKTDIYNL